VIIDDANPAELEKFIKEKKADILVGESRRDHWPISWGGLCDHNHERKHPLCGFDEL
jgi:nitrogenase molybdenum-cofactor synthesis protein NifE